MIPCWLFILSVDMLHILLTTTSLTTKIPLSIAKALISPPPLPSTPQNNINTASICPTEIIISWAHGNSFHFLIIPIVVFPGIPYMLLCRYSSFFNIPDRRICPGSFGLTSPGCSSMNIARVRCTTIFCSSVITIFWIFYFLSSPPNNWTL